MANVKVNHEILYEKGLETFMRITYDQVVSCDAVFYVFNARNTNSGGIVRWLALEQCYLNMEENKRHWLWYSPLPAF